MVPRRIFSLMCLGLIRRGLFVKGHNDALRRVQVQIIHRHGDRSPITALRDEEFWRKQLVDDVTLKKISSNTKLIESNTPNLHRANGRGPFGKLTQLGLLQLVQLGTRLREELVTETSDSSPDGNSLSNLFTPEHPLDPKSIRVISTNFLRTIQSVQGVLVGLFPDGTDDDIPIDIRHTDWMIPDPQPRRHPSQEELEAELEGRQHILEREMEMAGLAKSATLALQDLLAHDAHEATFGVVQETKGDNFRPLSWNQLAEITKCLAVRNMLPPGITEADQHKISAHAAWKWFETFSHPKLSHLSMGKMTSHMMEYFCDYRNQPKLTLWSAHDSTLIGLMCAFRLEQPAVWPEYGSYIMVELLEKANDLYVRFSLNGEVLKTRWDHDTPKEMIKLKLLDENMRADAEEHALEES